MEVALTPLINEMLQGSTRSVVALLIMVIVILMNELRASRRDLRRVQDKLDTQRTEYIANMNTIQDKYIQRTEDMSSKYHEALMSNHATLSKLTDVVHVIRETTNDINRGD